MAVRRVVVLEDAVDRALANLAEARECSVEALLEAAARHVARTMGGLQQPRLRYRLADPEIPEPEPVRPGPLPPVPRPAPAAAPRRQITLTAESLAKQDEAVRLYTVELRTLREVAADVGLNFTTVRRLLEHAGVQIRPRGWVPGKSLRGERVA